MPLLFGPSPVHRFERLSEYLGGQVEIWAKREDCNSGWRLGPSARGPGLRWARELQAQERELGVFFDAIIVCSVTGSTQAGMIAGFANEQKGRRIVGIDGSATAAQTRAQIARIARLTAATIGVGRDLRDEEIVLLEDWHAGTYGIPDRKTIDAVRFCARLEGVLTDPVYEGSRWPR